MPGLLWYSAIIVWSLSPAEKRRGFLPAAEQFSSKNRRCPGRVSLGKGRSLMGRRKNPDHKNNCNFSSDSLGPRENCPGFFISRVA